MLSTQQRPAKEEGEAMKEQSREANSKAYGPRGCSVIFVGFFFRGTLKDLKKESSLAQPSFP